MFVLCEHVVYLSELYATPRYSLNFSWNFRNSDSVLLSVSNLKFLRFLFLLLQFDFSLKLADIKNSSFTQVGRDEDFRLRVILKCVFLPIFIFVFLWMSNFLILHQSIDYSVINSNNKYINNENLNSDSGAYRINCHTAYRASISQRNTHRCQCN